MMPDKPIIIVSGLARCGTSLTMQMLHTSGLKCAGDYPAFEPPETNSINGPLDAAWLSQFEAVKIIDPHRARFPRINCRVLWLDRNYEQQALSQIKMVRMLAGFDVGNGNHFAMAKRLQKERPLALRQFIGMPLLRLDFEDAVTTPFLFATQIEDFIRENYVVYVDKMAACVMQRRYGVRCEPGMDIEANLVAKATIPDGKVREVLN